MALIGEAPWAMSSGVTLFDCRLLLVKLAATVRWNLLEPSRGTAFTRGPPADDSAGWPATSTTISWAIATFGDQLCDAPPAESRTLLYHMPSHSSGLSVL